ncbi:MAG: membrane dipeptidase [Blautia sp.]|nr:membrane dipeptidase [Blautia sp.]
MKIVDLHCDTILGIWNSELRGERLSLRDTESGGSPLQIDLKKLKAGDYLLQNFALFTDLRMQAKNYFSDSDALTWKTPGNGAGLYDDASAGSFVDPWLQVTEMIRIFKEEMAANADLIRQVRTFRDIEENMRNGLLSALLTTEEGGILQGDLSRLDELHKAGVRMMTITWNYDNELGHPNRLPQKEGGSFRWFFRFHPESDHSRERSLTLFGREAVSRMEELHIIPDVSHLSDEGFYDVADIVKGPFVASHSNARELCGCSRNLTDDMIRTIAGHGGVAGLNFCPSFVSEADREELCYASCEALSRHARHMMDIGGREVAALGTDFDGIAPCRLEIENASQMQKLADYMSTHGFTTEEIEGICFRNALRVYQEVLK